MGLDIDYIKLKILEVLKTAHSDNRKHVVKDFSDRINFSCPVCGEYYHGEKKENCRRGRGL